MNDFGIPEMSLGAGVQFPPGALLFVKHAHGVAITIHVVAHMGAVVSESGYEFTVGYSKWLGWYSPKVAGKGWEPCNQTHPAAYMPFKYAQMDTRTFSGGLLLRQRQAVGTSKQSPRGFSGVIGCLPGAVPSTLAELLEKSGVTADEVDRAVDFLYSDFAGEAAESPDRGVGLAITQAHQRLRRLLDETLNNEEYEREDDALGDLFTKDLLACGDDIARQTRMLLLAELSDDFIAIAKDTGDAGFARAGDALRRQLLTEAVDVPSPWATTTPEREDIS